MRILSFVFLLVFMIPSLEAIRTPFNVTGEIFCNIVENFNVRIELFDDGWLSDDRLGCVQYQFDSTEKPFRYELQGEMEENGSLLYNSHKLDIVVTHNCNREELVQSFSQSLGYFEATPTPRDLEEDICLGSIGKTVTSFDFKKPCQEVKTDFTAQY